MFSEIFYFSEIMLNKESLGDRMGVSLGQAAAATAAAAATHCSLAAGLMGSLRV